MFTFVDNKCTPLTSVHCVESTKLKHAHLDFPAREIMMEDEIRLREIEDARAEGYARGRSEARVRLALLADELRMMPERFVDAYGALVVSALKDGLEGRGAPDNAPVKPKVTRVRTKTSEVETRGLSPRAKPPNARGGAEVRNVRLLSVKSRIDRRLRQLTREIEAELAGGKGNRDIRKCTRCKKYGEDSWNWCPYDGAAMESEDRA